MGANLLGPGTYDKLTIIGTRIEDGKVETEPTIVITLADPDTATLKEPTLLSDYIYTTDRALKRSAKKLTAYGWEPNENEWNLGIFASSDNKLIGTQVGPVVIAMETYTNKAGETKTSPRIKKVGEVDFGFGIGPAEAKTITNAFQKRMRFKGASAVGMGTPGQPQDKYDDEIGF
jgi:hypothetical protein